MLIGDDILAPSTEYFEEMAIVTRSLTEISLYHLEDVLIMFISFILN